MDIDPYILQVIVGCGALTLLPRVLPLVLLNRFNLPKWYQDWLSFIPVTVMAALVAQQLLPSEAGWTSRWPELAASAACLACAIASRSLFLTVACGIAAITAFNYLS